MTAAEPVNRFVFIGGLHRSGTTMLARHMAEHPAVSGFEGTGVPADEGQHLQTVWPKPSAAQQAGRFAFDPQAHLTEASPLITDAGRAQLLAEWTPHWDMSRLWLLEKSPPNLLMMRFLQAMFPGARFIAVLRHPVAVACATQKWSGSRPHDLIRHWVVAHERFAADAPYVDRLLVVRYEDLVAEPDRVMARVFGFLDLDDPHLGRDIGEGRNADNFLTDRAVRTGVNEHYFRSWDERRAGIARRVYLELVARTYERRINRFGYSIREPRRPPSDTVSLARRATVSVH